MSLPAGLQAPTRTRVTVSAPAAGADWAYTVPANTWVKLILGLTTLTCSSTVINRHPGTVLKDPGGLTVGRLDQEVSGGDPRAGFVTPIMYNISHNWQGGGALNTNAMTLNFSYPRLIFGPGYTFGSVTPSMQTGDSYSQIELYLAVWTQAPFMDAFGPMWRPR